MKFYIWDLVQTFEIDYSKIDVYLEHRFYKYHPENGTHQTHITPYEIRKCVASDFNDTDFERNFWNSI
jgi:hypothetical protein